MNWENIRMFGMHPIRGIDETTRYYENTREFPLIVRMWMRLARIAGFLLCMNVTTFVLLVTRQYVTLALTYVIMFDAYSIVFRTRFDIWTPFGFQLFKWMITVR